MRKIQKKEGSWQSSSPHAVLAKPDNSLSLSLSLSLSFSVTQGVVRRLACLRNRPTPGMSCKTLFPLFPVIPAALWGFTDTTCKDDVTG